MEKRPLITWLAGMIAVIALTFCSGCLSSQGSGTGESTSSQTQQEAESNLFAIGLVTAQSSINPGETTTLTAIAYNASGGGISGLELVFTVDDPTLGYVTETATTDADGTATTTFTARTSPGTVNVTATSESVSSDARAITILDQTAPGNITLTANPTAVTATNTSVISATVTDSSGAPVDNGTTVTFEVANSTYGSITSSATTNSGVATATFTASTNAGTATINASSGSASASINVTVNPVSAASIEFSSVSKNPVAIRGSGGQEFSVVTFDVIDANGNPAEDVDVLFTMSGPGGAEYIEEDDATPYTQTVGTSNGVADITFHSGYEAGTVTINASITTAGGSTITASTPVISIGGGVPTDKWLSVAAEQRNLAGWAYNDIQVGITAYLADRFGNFNVLNGQSVSFFSEVGLALTSTNASADDLGLATVTVRTQGSSYGSPCEDVELEDWEDTMITIYENPVTSYGTSLSGNPRDGLCTVLVVTRGEEHFFDGSGGGDADGLYNLGETYTDTADDAFRDYDDDDAWEDYTTPADGIWDEDNNPDGLGVWDVDDDVAHPIADYTLVANPFEDYVDAADNDIWDGVNGVWDDDKNIFRNYSFLVTGQPGIYYYVEDQDGDGIVESSFVVEDNSDGNVLNADGDSTDTYAVIHFLICDANYNPMPPGSSFTVTASDGKLTGDTESGTYPDIVSPGTNIDFSVIVAEASDDIGDGDPSEVADVEISVSWATGSDVGGTQIIKLSIPGLVD